MNTPVEVRILFPSTSSGAVEPEIHIIDRMSNLHIATVKLTGAQFAELLASRGEVVMGEVLSREKYALVGMKAENESVDDWQEEHPEWRRYSRGYGKGEQDITHPDMEEWARQYIAKNGWDTFEWRRHNYGWGLIVRRHVEATQADVAKRLDRYGI